MRRLGVLSLALALVEPIHFATPEENCNGRWRLVMELVLWDEFKTVFSLNFMCQWVFIWDFVVWFVI